MALTPEQPSTLLPLVPAFEAGQLVNQLAWQLMHYAVLHQKAYRQQWIATYAMLAGKAFDLIPEVNSAIVLSRWIAGACDSRETWFDSPEYGDDLNCARRALAEGPKSGDGSDQELIFRAYHGIFEKDDAGIVRFRLQVELSQFTPAVWTAFLLGEVIDQGLHPPDVGLRLFERKPTLDFELPPPGGWAEALGAPWDRLPTSPAGLEDSMRKPTSDFLVRSPGELPPPVGWAENIRALWKRLPTSDVGLEDSILRGGESATKELTEFCKKALQQQQARPLPQPEPASRLVIDVANRRAILDGETIDLEYEQAIFLDLLWKAKGNWISSTEMKKANPDLDIPHFERLRGKRAQFQNAATQL